MGQDRFETDRNRFLSSERLIVELFLLSYIFAFFLGETSTAMPYLWLLISIIGGVITYFAFNKRDYSLGFGLVIALGLTMPLLLFGVPLMNVLLFFVWVLWRIQSNYNGSRMSGWTFLTINTVVFLVFTSLARLIFSFHEPELLVKQQIILYLLTSFLYFFIRMATITINSKTSGNFKAIEAGRVLAYILGLGSVVFIVVFMLLKPVRLGILFSIKFLFGGIFSLLGIATAPWLDAINEKAERRLEEELENAESGFVDFEMEEEMKIFGNSSSLFENSLLFIAFAVLLVIVVILLRKRSKKRNVENLGDHTFSFKGKKANNSSKVQMLYDYSTARDEVRKSFEHFEIQAQSHNFTRLHSETVKEWFSRMGWKQNDLVFSLYNRVRYGTHIPTENEHSQFIQELEQIKKRVFEKEDQ